MQFYRFWAHALVLSWAHAGAELSLSINKTFPFIPSMQNLSQANGITCWTADQSSLHTSVEGCRKTLNFLRTIPGYRLKQPFELEKRPRVPFRTSTQGSLLTPPFRFHSRPSDCALQIDTRFVDLVDDFSFEDVRRVATDLLEDCQSVGGHGGVASLGQDKGWEVQVVGYIPPSSENRTIL